MSDNLINAIGVILCIVAMFVLAELFSFFY